MKKTLLTFVTMCLGLTSQAQSAGSFPVFSQEMRNIASNNTSIKAAHARCLAQSSAGRVDVGLPDPEVEVAYLWGSPETVPGRKNITVSQSLDWGVLLGRQRRLANAALSSAEADYRMTFRDVMGSADETLVSMVYYNRLCKELTQRASHAREVMQMYDKMYERGETSLVELNKVRLNASVSEAELRRAQSERQSQSRQLALLNGGTPVEFADTLYPVSCGSLPPYADMEAALAGSAYMQQAKAAQAMSEAELRLAKADALPQLSVSFEGEYIKSNNYSGVGVGVSLPLWGNNRRRIKAAKASAAATRMEADDTTLRLGSSLLQLYDEARTLGETAVRLESDMSAASNERLLRTSLQQGQISLLDYLLELSFYYTARTAQLEAERDAQLALSRLRAMFY